MNEMYFKISSLQKKIDSNQKLRKNIRKFGILFIFIVFFFSLNEPDVMRVTWIATVVIIFLLFSLEVYYIKQSKKYEFELYRLEVSEVERKKELSKITGEILSDDMLNLNITEPTNEFSLPILYYVIILILDVMIRVLMIH